MKRLSLLVILAWTAGCGTVPHEPSGVAEPRGDAALVYEDTSQDSKASGDLQAKALELFQAGDWAGAEEAYAELVRQDPNHGFGWHHLGYALHAQGKLDEALPAHIRAANSSNREIAGLGAYNACCVYSLQGKKDQAFEWMGQAIEVGFRQMEAFENDPDLDNIRADERFEERLALMSLGYVE